MDINFLVLFCVLYLATDVYVYQVIIVRPTCFTGCRAIGWLLVCLSQRRTITKEFLASFGCMQPSSSTLSLRIW